MAQIWELDDQSRKWVEALVLRDETSIIDVAWAPQLGRSYESRLLIKASDHALLAACMCRTRCHRHTCGRRVDQHRDAFGRDARACGRLH